MEEQATQSNKYGLTDEQLKILENERIALDILIAPDRRLSRVAKRVNEVTFVEKAQIDDMFETMDKSAGMGLAAVQVGLDKRMIVMDVPKLSSVDVSEFSGAKTSGKFVIINPEIIESQGTSVWPEGCLSVPGFQDVVERSAFIIVNGLDREGNSFQLKAAGLLAACIQHEVDHLNGKLFIDHLSKLKRNMAINKLKKFRRKGTMVVKPNRAPIL